VTDDEIPGPRSGGGPGEESEEDYDATWDSLSGEETMDHLEEDALMDAIAAGTRGDLDADNLAQLLGRIRDKVDETDIPVPNLGKTERGENVVPPKRGESVSNPFEETAREFAGLKNLTPHEEAQTMFTMLGQIGEAGNALLPQGADNWRNKIEEVRQQALTLIEGLASLDAQIDQTAQRIAQGPGNL
jgi:hypothetical protein